MAVVILQPDEREPMPISRERMVPAMLAAAAVLAGIALRGWHVFTEPLWLDEAYSAYAADRTLGFLWRVVPHYETHPPFYYTLLHAWGVLAGDGLAMRRLPSLVAGLATIALAGAAGARLGEERRGAWWIGCVAAAIVAASPVLIEMSRHVRPYALMVLVQAAATIMLLRIARTRRAGGALATGALAAVLTAEALLAWLHSLGPLFALALAIALIVVMAPRGRRDWARIVGGHALVALAYVPAFLILLDQAPTWVASTWLRFDAAALAGRLALLYAVPLLPAAAAALALAGAGGWMLARAGRGREALALGVLALLPVALSLLLSVAIAPVFLPRTLSPAILPAALLMARGTWLPGSWRWLGLAAAAGLAAAMVERDVDWRRRGPMQHWHETVTWLAERHRPGDAIWAYPNEGALPFDYAARDRRLRFRARAIPAPVPALGIGYYPTGSRGAVSLRPGEIARYAAGPQARTAPTLWLLRLGPNAYDKGDLMLRALMAGGRRPVARFRAGPIDLIGLSLGGRGAPAGAGGAR